jgi:hypothetical protein
MHASEDKRGSQANGVPQPVLWRTLHSPCCGGPCTARATIPHVSFVYFSFSSFFSFICSLSCPFKSFRCFPGLTCMYPPPHMTSDVRHELSFQQFPLLSGSTSL